MLDATELPPTFSWPRERTITLLAGGSSAFGSAAEGAEDDAEAGERDLLACQPTQRDVVIGIAASGTTPYTVATVRAARPHTPRPVPPEASELTRHPHQPPPQEVV